ncbi:nucleoside hydrolase [Shigella flexneri]
MVPVGPLSNIAVAMGPATRNPAKIREIALMGGAYGTGNFTPSAEFNIFADPKPHACVHLRRSISDDGPRSHQPTVCTPDVIARMERAGGPAGELFSDIMNFTLKTQFENYGLAGGPVHDATCIGYRLTLMALKPGRCTSKWTSTVGLLSAYRLRRAGRSWQAR